LSPPLTHCRHAGVFSEPLSFPSTSRLSASRGVLGFSIYSRSPDSLSGGPFYERYSSLSQQPCSTDPDSWRLFYRFPERQSFSLGRSGSCDTRLHSRAGLIRGVSFPTTRCLCVSTIPRRLAPDPSLAASRFFIFQTGGKRNLQSPPGDRRILCRVANLPPRQPCGPAVSYLRPPDRDFFVYFPRWYVPTSTAFCSDARICVPLGKKRDVGLSCQLSGFIASRVLAPFIRVFVGFSPNACPEVEHACVSLLLPFWRLLMTALFLRALRPPPSVSAISSGFTDLAYERLAACRGPTFYIVLAPVSTDACALRFFSGSLKRFLARYLPSLNP